MAGKWLLASVLTCVLSIVAAVSPAAEDAASKVASHQPLPNPVGRQQVLPVEPGQDETPPGSDNFKKDSQNTQNTADPAESESFLGAKLPNAVSTKVRRFGYDLFANPPSTFAPVDVVPVGPDYLLGPGDEIRISVWGKVSSDYSGVIDRDGMVVVPNTEVMHLAGLSFAQAKEFIETEFSRYYKPSEVKVNVSMGKLRTISVFVVGKVEKPGSYTLSSLATLVNALFASGGPSRIGTMRNIELKRNGKAVVSFDLYDLLLKGDKTKDVRLMPEDVIFVPPVGPLAMVAGEVRAPGIYEMKGRTRIRDLIEMAGGPKATGYMQKVQVESIKDGEARTILDADLKDLSAADDILLSDGAVVKVYPISNTVVNGVSLAGNVVRSGMYQWSAGMRVSDLLGEPEKDLMPETFYQHALIERFVPPDNHKEIIAFDLGKALFAKDKEEDKELRPYDTVTVYSRWDFNEKPKVRVAGAVNRPAEYELMPNMKVSDLLKLAGGPLYYASYQSELTRLEATQEGPKVERVDIDLKKAMEGGPQDDIPLKTNDFLFVRTVPGWQLYRVVKIGGEVLYPGTYTIEKGETLSSLINRAGGYTDKAYLKGGVFTRESARVAQQKSLDEIVDRLEQEMLLQSAGSSSFTEEGRKKQESAAEKSRLAFLSKLKGIKSQGRIAIRLAPLKEFTGGPYDVELEDGDSLYIPQRPSSVQVAGAVYNQTTLIYQPTATVGSYISMAGGMTKDADEGSVYVLKVDGSAMSKSSRSGFLGYDKDTHSWMNGFMSRRLDPGDTIVVPMEFAKVDWLGQVKDLTTILYEIALGAGVVIAAF